MKKIMSLLLALLLVMSLGPAAFADGYTDMSTVTLTVTYNETNDGSTSPAETLAFTIERISVTDSAEGVTAENMPLPTLGNVAYDQGAAGNTEQMAKDLTITLPKYTSVGIYTYTIKQTAGTNAGVEYWSEDIRLVVTVIQDAATGLIRVAAVHTEGTGTGQKSDDITNTYSAGSLAVTKTVTGNMGDRSKYFAIKVTLTGEAGKNYASSYTVSGGSKLGNGTDDSNSSTISIGTPATFYLKHGETFTIKNLPYGVTYTVAEDNYTGEQDGGYSPADYTYSDSGTVKTVDTALETVTITNNKQATVDTGIVLDSLPYVLLLVLSIGGAVLFLLKRRSSRES